MFTIACCLVVGLGLGIGLGLDFVSGWQVMHTYLCDFRLELSHSDSNAYRCSRPLDRFSRNFKSITNSLTRPTCKILGATSTWVVWANSQFDAESFCPFCVFAGAIGIQRPPPQIQWFNPEPEKIDEWGVGLSAASNVVLCCCVCADSVKEACTVLTLSAGSALLLKEILYSALHESRANTASLTDPVAALHDIGVYKTQLEDVELLLSLRVDVAVA